MNKFEQVQGIHMCVESPHVDRGRGQTGLQIGEGAWDL